MESEIANVLTGCRRSVKGLTNGPLHPLQASQEHLNESFLRQKVCARAQVAGYHAGHAL